MLLHCEAKKKEAVHPPSRCQLPQDEAEHHSLQARSAPQEIFEGASDGLLQKSNASGRRNSVACEKSDRDRVRPDAYREIEKGRGEYQRTQFPPPEVLDRGDSPRSADRPLLDGEPDGAAR